MFQSKFNFPFIKMETQVDIIHRLVQRDMFLVIQDIFALLDIESLRNCELVSKSWYFAIRNDKIYKTRYERKVKRRPYFFRSLVQHAQLKIEDSEFFYKKLFRATEMRVFTLPRNINRRSNYWFKHTTFVTMDDKRIVVGENYLFNVRPVLKSSIIFVYDSFTLEFKCVFEAPGAGRVKYLQLQGDLLFGSFYSEKSIYVWDLTSKQIVQKIRDDISGECVDGLFHAAHNLLISCYNVASGAVFRKDIDGDSHLIVRRIHSPTQLVIEKKEHLPLWEINQVESDANFFAVSLSFGVPESREIQLRNKSVFQIIHRIKMSPDYKFCSFHNGQLLTVDTFSSQVQIQFWDIKKYSADFSLTLSQTKLSKKTLTGLSRVFIHCGYLIISEPIRNGGPNLVSVRGMWKVHDVQYANLENNRRKFVHLTSDNINNPRIPKTKEVWNKLHRMTHEFLRNIYAFGNTQFLEVTPGHLFQKFLHDYDF